MKRKLQVCNGYLLEFDQLARVMNYMQANLDSENIGRAALISNTGLSNRQIASLVSIGSAMGLIQRGRQTLSDAGTVISKYDIFLESRGALEWCHYRGAGSPRNLVWYEIFNNVVSEGRPMTTEGWTENLRKALEGQYSQRTVAKHLREEVRFVADAYLERNFRKLGLLRQEPDGRIFKQRYLDRNPIVFAAILYDYALNSNTKVLQIHELVRANGAPGHIFGMDERSLRELAEVLNGSGWYRYETTHNLDQLRLKEEYSPIAFLAAYFEGRDPHVGDPTDLLRGLMA